MAVPGPADALVDFLRSHQQEMADDLRWLVEMESPSTDKASLDRVAAAIAEYGASRAGAEARVIELRDQGNIVRLESPGSVDGPPVLLLAHFDTVWPLGSLGRLPFRIEGGRAYGPGTFDTKGGLVQGLWALRALESVGGPRRTAVMVCNADEEIGSPGSRPYIEGEAAASKGVLVLEPSKDGMLKTARKGAGVFSVKVTGKAAHAGLDPTSGVSAVEELCRVVLELHGLTDLTGGTTVNVGVIQGGTRANVVPKEATAEVDVRVPTKEEAARMVAKITGMKPTEPRATLEIRGEIRHPPMERTESTARLFRLARRVAGEMGEEIGECSVGGASDGNYCAAAGVPTLDGMGAVGAGAHSEDEHLVVREMPVRAALVARMIQEL